MAELMLSSFGICKQVVAILDGSPIAEGGLAYTENQAIDLAKALVEGAMDLEKPEDSEEKQAVLKLFNEENIELINT